MAIETNRKKDPAAVALGRKGGKKGGPARAAKLSPAQRSESARKAVQARWAKAETSDRAVLRLLKQLKTTDDPQEVRRLSNELERLIFHKQFQHTN
ncbi:MAG TPA: hypothetical protein VH640_04235 [Bryobacteraceae bacterium]